MKQEKQTANSSDVTGKCDILIVGEIIFKEGHLFLNNFKNMWSSTTESLLHVRQLRMNTTLEALISIHPVLRDKVWPGHAAYSVY